MPYTPTNWKNSPDTSTPVNAENLNKAETQYAQAVADSVPRSTQASRVYGTSAGGAQTTYQVSNGTASGAVVQRSGTQIIVTPEPTNAQSATAKVYVDTSIAAVRQELSNTGLTPEAFGAIGDGVADDTAAVQAAVDAVTPGGVVTLKGSSTYKIDGVVYLPTGVTLEGAGATLIKNSTATGHTILANRMYAQGYGGGGENITIRNVRIRGDYSLSSANYKDVTSNFMHIRGLRVENCVFEQGVRNGHYLDLQGCEDVHVVNCTFRGMNPISGREFLEAIQVDSATQSGAGHSYFGTGFFDGLPTRNVVVTGCTFVPVTVGGTEYPMPNPFGAHSGALVGDDGWYQDLWFTDNLCRGWTPDVNGNYWQGWVQLPGARNVHITGNTFAYTGPSRGSGRGSIISSRDLTSVVPLSEVNSSTPTMTAPTPTRSAVNWDISRNIFTGFATNFSDSASSLIYMDGTQNSRINVANNVSDAAKAGFCRIDNDLNVSVTGNTVHGSDSNTVINIRSCSGIVQSNTVTAATGGGILIFGCTIMVVSGNRTTGGSIGIKAANLNNGIIADNFVRNYSIVGIELGQDADTSTSFDTTISGNRVSSSIAGILGSIRIGTKSTRAFRWGNRYRDGGSILDTGVSTISTSALDTN